MFFSHKITFSAAKVLLFFDTRKDFAKKVQFPALFSIRHWPFAIRHYFTSAPWMVKILPSRRM